MNFIDSIASGFNRYFDFKTRSSRSEFWYFFLFQAIALCLMISIDYIYFPFLGGILFLIFQLIILFPAYAIAVRRLHDTGRSGLLVIMLIPSSIIGLLPYDPLDHGYIPLFYSLVVTIIFFILWALPGDPKDNQYGKNPLRAKGGKHEQNLESKVKKHKRENESNDLKEKGFIVVRKAKDK